MITESKYIEWNNTKLQKTRDKKLVFNNLCFMLQPEDFEYLQSLTDDKVKQVASELSLRHNRKLINLKIKVNDQNITTRKKENPAINLANEIFNLSQIVYSMI